MRVSAKVKEETERAILAAARKLFLKNGFESTSVRQIAIAAKIAVGTIFNYFQSKESLAAAVVAEALEEGRSEGRTRVETSSRRSLEEDLFTLLASDIRALAGIRAFIRDILETGLSPFSVMSGKGAAEQIRHERLLDAAAAISHHGAGDAVSGAVMHLYWALYVGVLSFWAKDQSHRQEDTWILLDQSVRMFAASFAVPRKR